MLLCMHQFYRIKFDDPGCGYDVDTRHATHQGSVITVIDRYEYLYRISQECVHACSAER